MPSDKDMETPIEGLSAYDLSEMSDEISATLAQGDARAMSEIARFVSNLGTSDPEFLRLLLPARLYNKLQTRITADGTPRHRPTPRSRRKGER